MLFELLFKEKNKILYHGTSTLESYEFIKENGLKPLPEKMHIEKYENEPDFAPIFNGVYLTKELWNATRYAFMTNRSSWKKELKIEPNGYVFFFNSEDLIETLPDEDEIGATIDRALKGDENLIWLKQKAIKYIEPSLLTDINLGSFAAYAKAGKILINKLTTEEKNKLISFGNNIVSLNQIKPFSCRICPKPQNRFFETKKEYVDYFNNNSKLLF